MGQPGTITFSRFFTQQIEECAHFFTNHQVRFIQFNLHTFRRLSRSERVCFIFSYNSYFDYVIESYVA